MNLKHDSDNVFSNGTERIQADSGADDGDRLDDLTAELLVLFSVELAEVSDLELNGLLEEGDEVLSQLLNDGAEGS